MIATRKELIHEAVVFHWYLLTYLECLRISGLFVPELLLLTLPELLRLLLTASVKFLLELALLGCFLRFKGV